MKRFKYFLIVILLLPQALCFAQVDRQELYSDVYLRAFTNQVLQKTVKNIRASSAASAAERKTIFNIGQCQKEVIASSDYLNLRLNQMQQSATKQEDMDVLNALNYLKSNRGVFYLIIGNPLLSEAERKEGLKMVSVDPIKEPDLMTKNEGKYLTDVALLIFRTGRLSDMQSAFLKRDKCKKYDLSQLVPAK